MARTMREAVPYAAPGALPTDRRGTGGPLLPSVTILALISAAVWSALWHVTASSGLDAYLPGGVELEVGDGRFVLRRHGLPTLSGDMLVPVLAMLAVPLVLDAVRRARRSGFAGLTAREVARAARAPLAALALLLVGGTWAVWARMPPTPPSWTPPPPGTFAPQIDRLESADVSADVEASLSRGDRRLMGVGTDAGVVPPGVPDYMANSAKYHREYGIRWIENTSDVIESAEHGRLHAAAYAYAERYNRLLLARTLPATKTATSPAP
jgi:hypothetical protein